MKNTYFQLSLAAIFLLCLSSCSSSYVGRIVDINSESVCKFKHFPASCSWTTDDFNIHYQIEETGKVNEYKVSGTAEHIGGQTFTDFQGATFTLLLIENRIVIETYQIAGGNGSLNGKITFSRNFISLDTFEASVFGYNMDVKG